MLQQSRCLISGFGWWLLGLSLLLPWHGELFAKEGSAWDRPQEITIYHSYWKPYEYWENGVSKGITVEFVSKAFTELGFKVKFKQSSLQRALGSLQRGEGDAMMSVSKTPEREAAVLFPMEPLLNWSLYIYFPADKVVPFKRDLTALAGLRIGIIKDWVYPDYFLKGPIELRLANRELTNMKKAHAGRLDGFVCGEISCQIMIKQNNMKGFFHMYRETSISDKPQYVAFSKKSTVLKDNPELLNNLAKVIKRLKDDGVLEELKRKYQGAG